MTSAILKRLGSSILALLVLTVIVFGLIRLVPGSLIDADGQPTNDPGVLHREGGSLLPFGEHKGYGLSIFAELLGGMLSGGGTIQPGNPRNGSIINCMLSVD